MKVVAFLCNWCTYAGADLAGTMRLRHRELVRIIRVPCSGRVDPLLVLKAFERGADGVIVGGCHIGDCHYVTGNLNARRRFFVVSKLLEFLGIERERFRVIWCSATEAEKWARMVDQFCQEIEALGPLKRYKQITGEIMSETEEIRIDECG